MVIAESPFNKHRWSVLLIFLEKTERESLQQAQMRERASIIYGDWIVTANDWPFHYVSLFFSIIQIITHIQIFIREYRGTAVYAYYKL